MNFAYVPPSLFLAQNYSPEFAKRALWGRVQQTQQHLLVALENSFLKKKPACHPQLGVAVRAKKGFGETGQDMGKAN